MMVTLSISTYRNQTCIVEDSYRAAAFSVSKGGSQGRVDAVPAQVNQLAQTRKTKEYLHRGQGSAQPAEAVD